MTQVRSDPLIARTDPKRRVRPLLICYLPIGDPKAPAACAGRYADHGVDIIEAGIGVLGPTLDGAVITASMHRAVAAGVVGRRAADVLGRQLSAVCRPAAVWMSYAGQPSAEYLAMVAAAGAQGVLLPETEPDILAAALASSPAGRSLTAIPFLHRPPTLNQIEAARRASAYVMVAATAGVTGGRHEVGADNAAVLAELRHAGISAPIALGFGIGTAAQARRAIELGADGVVVGSACVRAALSGADTLTRLLDDLRSALDV